MIQPIINKNFRESVESHIFCNILLDQVQIPLILGDRRCGQGHGVEHPGELLAKGRRRQRPLRGLEEELPAEGQQIDERVDVALLGAAGDPRGGMVGGEPQSRLGLDHVEAPVEQPLDLNRGRGPGGLGRLRLEQEPGVLHGLGGVALTAEQCERRRPHLDIRLRPPDGLRRRRQVEGLQDVGRDECTRLPTGLPRRRGQCIGARAARRRRLDPPQRPVLQVPRDRDQGLGGGSGERPGGAVPNEHGHRPVALEAEGGPGKERGQAPAGQDVGGAVTRQDRQPVLGGRPGGSGRGKN